MPLPIPIQRPVEETEKHIMEVRIGGLFSKRLGGTELVGTMIGTSRNGSAATAGHIFVPGYPPETVFDGEATDWKFVGFPRSK